MGCNGICEKFKAIKPVNGSRYETGQKRCQICEIFINWDGLFCPCCNIRLRARSRDTKQKKKQIVMARI